MAGEPGFSGRHYPLANGLNGYAPPQQDANHGDVPRSYPAEGISLRGRAPTLGSSVMPNLQTQQLNPGLTQTLNTATRSPGGIESRGGLERRPSNTASQHYRQQSKTHGNNSSSRNAIFVNPPTSSPLSPELDPVPDSSVIPDFNSMIRRGTSRRRPSASPSTTVQGSSQSSISSPTTTLAVDGDLGNSASPTMKRLERAQSSKSRKEHSHHRSRSRNQQEQKTVGEYALHHLFNKFNSQTDYKIKQCIFEPAMPVERVCGAGVDPDFDQLISSLAHITRRKPKPLVDTIMLWRMQKGRGSHVTNEALSPSNQSQKLPFSRENGTNGLVHDEPAYVTEHRSAIATYLTCRILIEIFRQADNSALFPQLFEKLEGIVFNQLERLEPASFETHPFREANYHIVGQLLGVMSGMYLARIGKCFLNALRGFQKELNVKGAAPRDIEPRAALMIDAMQHLHVKTEPDTTWRDSCELIYTLGDLFVNSHGQLIKHAYCQALEHLVIPVASNWNSSVTSQRWKDFLNIVNVRLSQMLIKPRHWQEAFRLSIIVLCASPTEHFASLWLQMATSQQAKLKDRMTRATALEAICRLVWTYLSRVPEPTSGIALRKLDDVVKAVLPSGKRSFLTVDPSFSTPIVELIRIIGFKYPEFCFKNIVFPLVNADHLLSAKELKIEQFEPERMIVGIRAFLLIMTDLEQGEHGRPPFPRFSNGGLATDPNTVPEMLLNSQQQGKVSSTHETIEERASRPVLVARLSDPAKEIFARFCEALGKIITACDSAFGGQAVLDEKFGGLTPKTPITDAFSFARRGDDHAALADHKLGFYELLHVAIQAVPLCLASDLPLRRLINLLCTATAHVQSNIAASATQSLKSIAQHGHAQAITTVFASFIFNFDVRYSTMSDEGMLGPGHIENTLRLYIELLQIWIGEIKQKTKDAAAESSGDGSRGLQLGLTSLSPYVEEVEAHGVFFLCSQSRIVRSYAVKVLKIVTELDAALGKQSPRIIHILEGDSQRVIDIQDESLNMGERNRLEKGKRSTSLQSTLIELCSSDISSDASLWLKLFPNIIRLSLDVSPLAVEMGREIVCTRLVQMHDSITRLDSEARLPPLPGVDHTIRSQRFGVTPPEVVIEQWKLYLIMACTTMKDAGAQTQSQLDNMQHARKLSKGAHMMQDRTQINSARALVAFVIPLLSASQSSIREAIVISLGSIHLKLYRTLLESLQYAVTTCKEEAKQRIGTHQRTGSNPQKDRRTDRLRTEVTQVYRLTARFLQEDAVLRDEWILNNLCTYTKDLMIFLSDSEIQNDWECQKLRRQYCGLMEEVFNGVNRTSDPSRYIAFESRKSAFALMEDWCGFSPNVSKMNQREDLLRQSMFEKHRDPNERTSVAARMNSEREDLIVAALSAMASLCAGPIMTKISTGTTFQFDSRRILAWISLIFQGKEEKMHPIGRRALLNLIMHNQEHTFLMEYVVEQCYVPDHPRQLESHFEVVAKILNEQENHPLPFWRILGAMLFTLGNERGDIRMKSSKLLQRLEQRRQQKSGIQDFDISISDRTKAVYKQAQFDMSQKLSEKHLDLAFFIFSQFSAHFRNINAKPDSQRNMVATILPWIRVIELQTVDIKGGPTPQSYMVLTNLLEITIKASSVLHNEIQALWQALAARHAGNVQLVLDFVIRLCLDRRDHNLVDYTKQIVVYLSKTPAGQKVVEFLLLQITPKNMVQKPREPIVYPPDNLGLPYVANLSEALPTVKEQNGFSQGHLSLIFLVDLLVGPIKLISDEIDPDSVRLKPENIALLLQELFVLWDSNVPLVQEQAREMLVHLIHGLVITGIEDGAIDPTKSNIEEFVELVRRKDPSTIWQYRERDGRGEVWSFNDKNDELRVPASMPIIANRVISMFKLVHPGIQDEMARVALQWGTSCPVRHIACRSLQIFRCILVPLDRSMLIDVLARISNTVVHEEEDVQLFAIEMLTTLKIIIGALAPSELLQWPHLFWTACACLDTIYEREFVATIAMIEKLLSKINLGDPAVVRLLEKSKPTRWQGPFEGITPFIYKGLKSELALEKSLHVLDTLVALPNSGLVGDQTRLLFVILANLPCFLQSFEEPSKLNDCMQCAANLATVADAQDEHQLAMVLNTFAKNRYSAGKEFLAQILSTLRRAFFPAWELKSLIFVIGLLTNRLHWYKVKTLEFLQVLFLDVDTQSPLIANQGPDLISPLLRLLQTKYCPQAIEVLDNIMYMSETPMTRHHMRMSMAGLGSRSLPVRKEYEKTQSLYGIPEETGWSVPMPGVHSNTTRANMQVIHHDCAHPSAPETETIPTPEIEFHPEEEHHSSYFSLERADTLQPDDNTTETPSEDGMGDLLTKLNSLNDFFDDTLDPSDDDPSNRYYSVTITPYNQDSDVDIYDQVTGPILDQTLARTASVTSFHNGYAEAQQRRHQDPAIMTPGAFSPPPMTGNYSTQLPSQRPSLHSRSVTSPANNIAPHLHGVNELVSDDDADETFSEDERATGHNSSSGAGGGGLSNTGSRLLGSTSLHRAQSSLRSKLAPGAGAGTGSIGSANANGASGNSSSSSGSIAAGVEGREYRQRGMLRAQSQSRNHGHQQPSSPRVPKVPDAYLNLKMGERSDTY